MKNKLLFILIFLSFYLVQAQSDFKIRQAFYEKMAPHGYSPTDIKDMIKTDDYVANNGVRHIYFQQVFEKIPIQGTITGLHFYQNHEVLSPPRFIKELTKKISSTEADITLEQAKEALCRETGFVKDAIQDERCKLMFVHDEGELELCWAIVAYSAEPFEAGQYFIHARSGELANKHSYIIKCNHGKPHDHIDKTVACQGNHTGTTLTDNSSYLVYAEELNGYVRPLESPLQGPRKLIENPVHPTASPQGWHRTKDTFYTRTIGNNAYAYQSLSGDLESMNDEPDGGVNLVFTPPLDTTLSLQENIDALVVNSFFMTNFMHDYSYIHGFDEPSGNFQTSNFEQQGLENDEIRVLCGFNGDVNLENNAFYIHAPDGESGRVFLPFWGAFEYSFNVNTPSSSELSIEEIGGATFGPPVDDNGFTGNIIQVEDSNDSTSLACGMISNLSLLENNIALIDRGDCFFTEKVSSAQAGGAVGVIICNYEEEVIVMSGEDPNISIPSIFLKQSDCEKIKVNLPMSVTVKGKSFNFATDFDNGITAHEYAHGISMRLSGGPSSSDCLFNEEQMGEGWSDFYALASTIRVGDDQNTRRPIGQYVINSEDAGIRRYDYSYDMTVNPLTLDDLPASLSVHEVGTIWASVLWDLYWDFVDVYGFNENLMDTTGGNNMVVRIVTEAMKLQPCSPGFEDGRDAILQADTLLYNGVNGCLIWSTFTRRGMGYGMNQGSPYSITDNESSYQPHPKCASAEDITISKTMTELIQAGDTITINLNVLNTSGITQTNLTLSDSLPENAIALTGNSAVYQVNIDTLRNGEERNFTYQVLSDPDYVPTAVFSDGADGLEQFTSTGDYAFQLNTTQKPNDTVWYVNLIGAQNSESILETIDPIKVPLYLPLIAFEHRVESEVNEDAGIVEVLCNDNEEWEQLNVAALNGYDGSFTVNNETKEGFSGEYPDFRYSIFDLGSNLFEDCKIRFRFLTDGSTSSKGWSIDNISVFSQFNYNSKACLSQDNGDKINCTTAPNRGTLVLPEIIASPTTSSDDKEFVQGIRIYPNPATNSVHISSEDDSPVRQVRLLDISGKEIRNYKLTPSTTQTLELERIPGGTYILIITTDRNHVSEKLIIGQ